VALFVKVKRYHNKKETSKIGAKIRDLRNKSGFSLDDVAYMTGFTQSLLSAIENGSETGISHLIEIGKAIGVHPKEILDLPMEIKPRFRLSPQRKERNRLTFRITALCNDTDFFDTPRFVRDVVDQLLDDSKAKISSASVAVVMKRLNESGKLKHNTVGRQKQYFKKKK
jgi:transcriptional regulator with XRE-family HTH domain